LPAVRWAFHTDPARRSGSSLRCWPQSGVASGPRGGSDFRGSPPAEATHRSGEHVGNRFDEPVVPCRPSLVATTSVRPGALRGPGRVFRGLPLVLPAGGARVVLLPHVLGDHRIPPVLLPPGLQDQPGLPVPAGVPGHDQRTEGRVVVGRPPSGSSQVLRCARGPALTGAARLLVVSGGLDSVEPVRRHQARSHPRLRAVPRAALAQPPLPGSAGPLFCYLRDGGRLAPAALGRGHRHHPLVAR
jgi:hypothetical protein